MSNLKERLQQIKDEVAIEHGWNSFSEMAGRFDCPKFMVDKVSKRYAAEVIKEVESELDRKIEWYHKQSLKAWKDDKIKYEASTNCLVIFKMWIKDKFQY